MTTPKKQVYEDSSSTVDQQGSYRYFVIHDKAFAYTKEPYILNSIRMGWV